MQTSGPPHHFQGVLDGFETAAAFEGHGGCSECGGGRMQTVHLTGWRAADELYRELVP